MLLIIFFILFTLSLPNYHLFSYYIKINKKISFKNIDHDTVFKLITLAPMIITLNWIAVKILFTFKTFFSKKKKKRRKKFFHSKKNDLFFKGISKFTSTGNHSLKINKTKDRKKMMSRRRSEIDNKKRSFLISKKFRIK